MILKSIDGYEGVYAMDEGGNVYRLVGNTGKPLPSPKPIKQHVRKDGYALYQLSKEGVLTAFLAHRLIWQTMRGEFPAGQEINHRNGNRSDNRLENLELCSRSENILHKFRVLGYKSRTLARPGEAHPNSVATDEQVRDMRKLWASGVTQTEIGRRFGLHQTTVSDIVRRKRWGHIA